MILKIYIKYWNNEELVWIEFAGNSNNTYYKLNFNIILLNIWEIIKYNRCL